ncbi:unnamed protein product [Durusdinium trenchii]|uniref:Protein kinase domain-containing protein n=1 Tax=Durusdinium trenchii TaxID=1381693 RepID=A0ABP0JP73_9DINO
MPFRAGDTVGAYAVDRLLGRGAYGEVFLVHGQVQYAMKVIPCDLGPKQDPGLDCPRADPTLQAALVEASLLQELRYPHIVCELGELSRQKHRAPQQTCLRSGVRKFFSTLPEKLCAWCWNTWMVGTFVALSSSDAERWQSGRTSRMVNRIL